METSQVFFNQVVSRGCGPDVHKKVVIATIDGEGIKTNARVFHHYEFFERDEKLFIGERRYPRGKGKYRRILEACL